MFVDLYKVVQLSISFLFYFDDKFVLISIVKYFC